MAQSWYTKRQPRQKRLGVGMARWAAVRSLGFLFLLAFVVPPSARAQAPGEVQGVVVDGGATISWAPLAGADFYHVYRGDLAGLATGAAARCHGFEIGGTSFVSAAEPAAGAGHYYLVSGESTSDGEGTPGGPSAGGQRALLGRCMPVMRDQLLDRLGFGWSEWSRDSIETLGGLQAYIAEQLEPALIDESTNTDLNDRLAPWDPPADILQLIGRQVVSAVYARRQLEQQAATFWANHFNTYWGKIAEIFLGVYPQCDDMGMPEQCDPAFPAQAYLHSSLAQHSELEAFRSLAFGGSFREMLETSALSPAMILFLDTYVSVGGNPNENYPRELLELSTMGVGGGYTQTDVEELARVITGFTICKKKDFLADDPLSPCVEQYWITDPASRWAALFVPGNHDCTQKTLFQGTPQETIIPDTCSNPPDGLADLDLALDAIVAHPSTPQYISRKILERFVTDQPDQAMIDVLVAEWNDATNPAGVGDGSTAATCPAEV